jgi:L-ascorbate metabolism protein UlaG (beta-lactamase superfamily)
MSTSDRADPTCHRGGSRLEAVTSERVPFGVAILGGPTTLVDIGGHRVLVDPTFDPPGDHGYLHKTAGPAVTAEAVGVVDVVLVSHDQHPDNLDDAGRELALRAPALLTTPTSAARLGTPAHGMPTWTTWTSNDNALTITALPARHGPADGETDADGFVNCEVAGFLLAAQDGPSVYVSGDNASLEHVRAIREHVGEPDVAVLFAGAASVPTKFQGRPLSLTSARAAAAAEVLNAAHVVVAHQTGWTHFHDGPEQTRRAFADAGIAKALCQTPLGAWCTCKP